MTLAQAFRLLPSALLLAALWLPCPARASDLTRYKELRNDYIKVTDIRERERFEERYVEGSGKVTLQKVPYKEILITAELTQKPPSNMDTMFTVSDPAFKICMTPFDAAETKLEDICESLRFQSMVKGNVGTASFRLPQEATRYDFRVAQKQPDKSSSIKLWVPTD